MQYLAGMRSVYGLNWLWLADVKIAKMANPQMIFMFDTLKL